MVLAFLVAQCMELRAAVLRLCLGDRRDLEGFLAQPSDSGGIWRGPGGPLIVVRLGWGASEGAGAIKRAGLERDRVTQVKTRCEEFGRAPSNLRYGYVLKG